MSCYTALTVLDRMQQVVGLHAPAGVADRPACGSLKGPVCACCCRRTHVLLLPAAGEYTAERLKELQAATAQLPSKYKPPAAAAAGDDGSFKLSGSFKAAKKPNDDRFTYNYSIHGTVSTPGAAAAGGQPLGPGSSTAAAGNGAAAGAAGRVGEPQGERMPLPPPPKRPGGGAAAAAGGAGGSGSESEDADAGFALPDEETIKYVKEQCRENRSLSKNTFLFQAAGTGV